MSSRTSMPHGLLLAGIAAFIIVGGILASPRETPQQRARVAEREQTNTARAMAQTFVERSLKAPATAKFSSYGETAAERREDGAYEVRGWVDAQNSFGALMRNNYRVTMRNDVGDHWRTEDLQLTPR